MSYRADILDAIRRASTTTDLKTRNAQASWLRASSVAQTFPRLGFAILAHTLTSGTLYLAGGAILPARVPVSNITFVSQAAAIGPTNQWFCIVRAASPYAILAVTADDTTTAWGATSFKTLAITGAPYTPAVDEQVYLGVMQAAGTPATLTRLGVTPDANLRDATPPVFATAAPSGLTTPGSLASITSIASISSGTFGPLWADVS